MNLTVKFSESDSTSKATLYTSDEVFDAAIGLGNSKAGNLTEAKGIVEARLYSSDQEMTAHMEVGGGMGGGLPLYTGDYEVTPKIEAQKLDTANRSMEKDVTIHAIPYYEVDNASNGQTIVIGGN